MDNKEENGPAKSKPSTSKSQKKSLTSVNSLKELEKLDSYNNEILNKIKLVLEQNSRVLLIMRGLPGSGKSTLAK
jgi:ABC-type polysaccharide/polyol phosphate transport system ATPase subunit